MNSPTVSEEVSWKSWPRTEQVVRDQVRAVLEQRRPGIVPAQEELVRLDGEALRVQDRAVVAKVDVGGS